MTLRTIHAGYEKLDPTEYEYVEAFDSQPEPGSFMGLERQTYTINGTEVEANNFVHAEYLWLTGLLRNSSTSVYGDSGQCDHCGAHLRYVVVLKHLPTNSYMATGETCYNERFVYSDKVTKDVDRLRKKAAAGRLRSQVRARFDAWTAESEDNSAAVAFLQEQHEAGADNDFLISVFSQLNKKGELSERQVAAVLRNKAGAEKYAKVLAERELEEKVPVVEGRQQIVGTVLKLDVKDSDYGLRYVMTVKDDRGFVLWGTNPLGDEIEKGDRIKFAATVTKSDRDECFGFFKRPAKAERVGEVA